MADDILSKFKEFENRLRLCEEKVADQAYDTTGFMTSEFKRRDKKEMHRSTEFSVYKTWCVDTLDTRRQGRVRYFSPYLHEPNTPICSLPFASPISPLPGFDDSGCVWVPPAGSSLMIIFEAGSSYMAYYIGTIWPRYRGPDGKHVWDQLISLNEYKDIHDGHRKGYLLGANDGSQVLPMWNTENYNAFDLDQDNPFELPDIIEGPINLPDVNWPLCGSCTDSFPHIMGMKTPQKHMIKFDDGDYKCNYRWKRLEIMSSLGNWMIFKDDHLHEGGQWASPLCNIPCSGEQLDCVDENCNPIPIDDCTLVENPGRNQYFKHQNECRPYTGPGTPQNNRCNLPQAGVQILSTSGHTMILDDSVEQPQGIPEWEKVLQPFDFGCNNIFLGKMMWKSTTGHRFEINDEEQETNLRGRRESLLDWQNRCGNGYDPWARPILDRGTDVRPARNGMLLLTASGNRIELNDDTIDGGIAGPNRGITIQSTSNHVIEMIDYTNDQASPPRMEGGAPSPDSQEAYIRIRSGYGLTMEFRDYNSQKETQNQYIQITAPQITAVNGPHEDGCKPGNPHFLRFQEAPNCGFVLLRVGGDYVRSTDRNELVIVGPGCDGPSSKFLAVSNNYIVDVKQTYFNKAYVHVFFADTYIILGAGKDCPNSAGVPNQGPCIFPVATSKCASFCPIVQNMICLSPKSFSDRVFASNDDSPCQ